MAGLPVYMVDFTCFSPPDELRVDFKKNQDAAWRWKVSMAAPSSPKQVPQGRICAPLRALLARHRQRLSVDARTISTSHSI